MDTTVEIITPKTISNIQEPLQKINAHRFSAAMSEYFLMQILGMSYPVQHIINWAEFPHFKSLSEIPELRHKTSFFPQPLSDLSPELVFLMVDYVPQILNLYLSAKAFGFFREDLSKVKAFHDEFPKIRLSNFKNEHLLLDQYHKRTLKELCQGVDRVELVKSEKIPGFRFHFKHVGPYRKAENIFPANKISQGGSHQTGHFIEASIGVIQEATLFKRFADRKNPGLTAEQLETLLIIVEKIVDELDHTQLFINRNAILSPYYENNKISSLKLILPHNVSYIAKLGAGLGSKQILIKLEQVFNIAIESIIMNLGEVDFKRMILSTCLFNLGHNNDYHASIEICAEALNQPLQLVENQNSLKS